MSQARLHDLEIPLIPESDQYKVVVAQQSLNVLREQAERLNTQLNEMQNTLLDGLFHHVKLQVPANNGEAQKPVR